MEEYHSTSRFILTCNYPNRIIPALHSRCQGFHVERTDMIEYTARVATILVEENIDFDLDTLDLYVKSCIPRLTQVYSVSTTKIQLKVHWYRLTKQMAVNLTGSLRW